MNCFEIKWKEKNKYNKLERKVLIKTAGNMKNAIKLFRDNFGSLKKNILLSIQEVEIDEEWNILKYFDEPTIPNKELLKGLE